MAIISNSTTIADAGAFSVSLGSQVLIKTITISSGTSTISFVNGASSVVFDGTYPLYKVVYASVHHATDGSQLQIGFRDGGSDYDAVIQSSSYTTYHQENDSESSGDRLNYSSGRVANSSSFQNLHQSVGSDNDQCASGEILIFSPSNTTFSKHYLSRLNSCHDSNANMDSFIGGYVNTATAIDAIQFKSSSGNIDSGIFKLYGIKDS
tara:strand:- start:1496 stop:2119 length:624 start_codon:yes stop_codon:yes gene_type:complete